MTVAGPILRDARLQAGLSQVELSHRAGVTQSVASAYESGARQPSLPMLQRLVDAMGSELELRLRPPHPSSEIARRLRKNRRRVLRIARSHGLTKLRVFGSVARGDEITDSDVDLLVDVAPGIGMFEFGRCQSELQALLGAPVDLVSAADLKPGVAEEVLAEARAL